MAKFNLPDYEIADTLCGGCVIRLWADKEFGMVDVEVLSNHAQYDKSFWSFKWQRIKNILKERPDPSFEFIVRDEAQNFIEAFQRAMDRAWPKEE